MERTITANGLGKLSVNADLILVTFKNGNKKQGSHFGCKWDEFRNRFII